MSDQNAPNTTHRTCHRDGTEIRVSEFCPACMAWFEERPNAETMTGDERAAEMEIWYGPLQVPFPKLHERIEELVGRPVWTHELADKDRIINEARTRTRPTAEQFMAPLAGKPVMAVRIDAARHD